jgi:O-methyltransferase involved in polyketide biosynthesis
VDFERESFLDRLVATGFDRAQPGFFSWLGVTQYLTLAAIDATLCVVASLPHPSGIVFSFVLPDEDLTGLDFEAAQDGATANAARGEPWLTRFRAEELKARLRELGFATIYHLTPADVEARYFAGRRDGLRPHTIEQMLRATVSRRSAS